MILDTLYKTAKSGAIQVMNISVSGDSYTVTWGQKDGKMQTKTTTCIGKNIGKANETTAEEQAILEAKAYHAKKQKANYSTSEEAPVTVKLPMKVNDYHKHKKKIKFPCFTSPKLNGVNAEYRLVDGTLKLLSRGGEEYPIPAHQERQALDVLNLLGTTSINGEMYLHGEHLQDIMAATKKPNDLSGKLQFHVFDFPEVAGEYKDKCPAIYKARAEYVQTDISSFPFVPVWVANSHEELDDQHEQCEAAGYEGLIIRNPEATYEYNTRSLNVFKYKKTQDAEFEVVGYDLDKNGHAVFTCVNINSLIPIPTSIPNGINTMHPTFKVKLKGTNEERLAMAAEADNYIGKFLKVEYEMLSKDGIPLKPVGIMFRKVDADGEAIE